MMQIFGGADQEGRKDSRHPGLPRVLRKTSLESYSNVYLKIFRDAHLQNFVSEMPDSSGVEGLSTLA